MSAEDELLRPLLEEAERDANVVGVFVKGSRSLGIGDDASDWDLVVVLSDGEPSHSKMGQLDVLRTTLARLRRASSYELPAIAHSQVLLDKTGQVGEAVAAAAKVEHAELVELYDSYLNDFYRSLKAWQRGRELAARIKAVRSLWYLGDLLFALDGRRAPYPSAWGGRLGELESLILEVARTADPTLQQQLQARVERIATARGLRKDYDGWDGEIDRVMAFEFPDR